MQFISSYAYLCKLNITSFYCSDFENDDVFASPTPVRRTTRGRKGKQSAKSKDESMKKSLSKELDVGLQEETEKPRTVSTRSTRSRVSKHKNVDTSCKNNIYFIYDIK